MALDDSFSIDLARLLNRHSVDNECSTADWVLAAYVCGMLVSYRQAVNVSKRLAAQPEGDPK